MVVLEAVVVEVVIGEVEVDVVLAVVFYDE